MDVTTGQRKYGGPPPDTVYSGVQPGIGTEVFVGKIPRDLYEDELVPLFEKAGAIWDLRLMMDPLSGQNRGYAFITFCSKDAAQEAVKLCDNYEIRPGKHLGVCISVANNRLFVGSIPKNKTKENILEEFNKVTGKHLHHDFCHGCKIPLSLFHSCSNVTDAFRSYLNYFQILFQNFILKYTLW